MKQILIDKFLVPREAIEDFTNRMNYNRNIIKGISGFLSDTVYKKINENGKIIIITIAEWKDENSLATAREAVQNEYKRNGFDLPGFIARYAEFNIN